jgi:spermidine synthase
MSALRCTARVASAALIGAGGLASESVLIALGGLAIGHSRASALGLGAYVAGWSAGALWAGRSRRSPATQLAALAIAAPIAHQLARAGLSALGARFGASSWGAAVSLGLIALAAAPQGIALPALARADAVAARRAGVGALIAASLLGALAGGIGIGYAAVGAFGRSAALWIASASTLAGGATAASVERSAAARVPAAAAAPGPLSAARCGWIASVVALWSLALEWSLLRLGVLWTSSDQLALATVLAASLLALAIGAGGIAPLLPRGERGVVAALALALAASAWPLVSAPAVRAASEHGELAALATLAIPALAPLGAIVPALHRTARGESGARLGSILGAEIAGALAAGPLAQWCLVPRFGVGGSIGVLACCAPIAALALVRRSELGRRTGVAAVAGLSAAAASAVAAGFLLPEPALATPTFVDPALAVRSFAEDGEFAVAVVDDGVLGERTLLTDRFRAAGTGRDYRYMRVLGHLPLLVHPAPRRVAVLALGTGTTLGAVSLHGEIDAIDVLEISDAVVAAAPWFEEFNRGALRDPRVRVVVGDGRASLARAPGGYDVVTMEPLLPDSPFGVYLYTPEFYAVAKRALATGGYVCQWVPPHALEPDVFEAVLGAFARSFAWSSAWTFGTQVLLLGGEREPAVVPARFPDGAAPELARALHDLGLDSADRLFLRFGCPLERWEDSGGRELSDDDPWIAFRRKPGGVGALGWLAENLAAIEGAVPPAGDLGPGFRAYRSARIEHARGELLQRTGALSASDARARVLTALAPALEAAGDDPEVLEFRAELDFLHHLRQGVALAQRGRASDAVRSLVQAVELRPERGDAHLYLGTTLALAGEERLARAALAQARELCPRILETPAGRRALDLGLDPRLAAGP